MVTRAGLATRVDRASGRLATAAVRRMRAELPWFGELSAEEASWVGLVAQAGISAFADWLRRPADAGLEGAVFGAAPRELARVVTLQQTVELVRLVVAAVEDELPKLAKPEEQAALHEAVLQFSREIAFAAAYVYASAAEERGAWHARQRALFVDALLRGEHGDGLKSQAHALGWEPTAELAVVAGWLPAVPDAALEALERHARAAGLTLLAGVQGERLVALVGADAKLRDRIAGLLSAYAEGPVVVGPLVGGLEETPMSAAAALAGLRVATAWPEAPRPVDADDLLPERALDGDPLALDALVALHALLAAAGDPVLETTEAYLASGCSVEATARASFLHPNTVRYRLRRASEACGHSAFDPREAHVLRVALTVGRLRSR